MLHILLVIVEGIVFFVIAAFVMLYLARLMGDFERHIDERVDARVDAKLAKWEQQNRSGYSDD